MKAPHLVSGVKPNTLPIARAAAELRPDHTRAAALYEEMAAAWSPFVTAFSKWVIEARPSLTEVMQQVGLRVDVMKQHALAAQRSGDHGR